MILKNCKRMIAIGDIHGRYNHLVTLIEKKIKFNPLEDVLIFLGDYIDRASCDDDWSVINYLSDLYDNNDGVILLMGNHEHMAKAALENEDYDMLYCWAQNGAGMKIYWSQEKKSKLLSFINRLRFFLETDDYIFVHAGATEDAIKNIDLDKLLWERHGNQKRCFNKKLVLGHTIRKEILIDDNRICLDTGVYKYNVLSAYDVLNNKAYQCFK